MRPGPRNAFTWLALTLSVMACTGPGGGTPSPTPSATVTATATVAASATPFVPTPTPPPTPEPMRPLPAFLSGPFGSLDGTPWSEATWPGADGLRALDTLAESAPLALAFRDADVELDSWSVSVAPADDASDATSILLGDGPREADRLDVALFDGPGAGDWIVRAALVPVGRLGQSDVWLLHVPDVPLPSGGLEPPLPDLLVTGGEPGVVTATPWSSCYVSVCADPGSEPDPGQIASLFTGTAVVLALALSDESSVTAWTITATAADGSQEPLTVAEGRDEQGVMEIDIQGLGLGDWLVRAAITFDLERGAATYFLRVNGAEFR